MQKIVSCTCVLILIILATIGVYAQCPVGTPPGRICEADQDENGAFYLIVVPQEGWNGKLVFWNHGYTLNPPAALGFQDLGPTGILTGLGFAAAASSFRPNAIGRLGWAVSDGAEDTHNLLGRFQMVFGKPERTYVIGASMGSLVTEALMERHGKDEKGNLNYDGAMPMCGPLAGGRRNWYGGLDLRVVYQYYCRNLPRDSEPQYDLFLGLHPQSQLTQADVIGRVNECTGILLAPDDRSETQRRNLANILGVTTIPEGPAGLENFLITDMLFGTFALQELTLVRTGGRNPLTNIGVQYRGSEDDTALNAGVARYSSNREALEYLISSFDPQGTISAPTLTIHTIGDGLVIIENENAYLQTLADAGTDSLLQQNYINASGHCQFSFAEMLAPFHALRDWVESGTVPTRASVDQLCRTVYQPMFGGTCNFNLEFEPDALETRIIDRTP